MIKRNSAIRLGVCFYLSLAWLLCLRILSFDRVIVSLTSYPQRYPMLMYTLKSLKKQSRKPDLILLNLSEAEISSRGKKEIFELLCNNHFDACDLNESLLRVRSDVAMEKFLSHVSMQQSKILISWFSQKMGPYGKLIPTLKLFPDDIIITVDDDIEYHARLIEELLAVHTKFPHCIISNTCNLFVSDCVYDFERADRLVVKNQPILNGIPEGCSGVLYPPHSFNDEIFNEALFLEEFATTDDIWFALCAVLNNTKKVKLYHYAEYHTIRVNSMSKYHFQVPQLWTINKCGKNNENLAKAKKILESYGFGYYPVGQLL